MWKKSRRPASAISRPLASVVGVAVQVDETGNDELAGGVDALVDGPGERAADERTRSFS